MNGGARYPADSSAIKSSVARSLFELARRPLFFPLRRAREISRLTKEEITARCVSINRHETASKMLRPEPFELCLSIARDRRLIAIIAGHQRLVANIKDDDRASHSHMCIRQRELVQLCANEQHPFTGITCNTNELFGREIYEFF